MTSSPSRRDRNKRARLQRIKEAAWTLFVERGYETTTIRQIAEVADVSPATVILHTGEKADLLMLLFHEVIAERIQPPSLDDGLPLEETLMGLLRPFIRFYGEYPELSRVFFREMLYGESRWREQELEQAEGFVQLLARIIGEHQERGQLREDADPTLLAQTIFSLYQAALQGWFCGAISFTQLEPVLARQLAWQVEVHRI